MLRKFEDAARDYPRPSPPFEFDGRWTGSIKIGENEWMFSDQTFETEDAALRWAVETVEDMKNAIT